MERCEEKRRRKEEVPGQRCYVSGAACVYEADGMQLSG